jgi:hypothetical protein
MRLSEVLSKAPTPVFTEVAGFLDDRPLGWGKHRKITIGNVVHNFLCRQCGELRTFASGNGDRESLYALGLGETAVSIDVALKCTSCGATVETWFLVACNGDISVRQPEVRVERYMENLRDKADRADVPFGPFSDLVRRAQIAFEAGLGAGSMIYLRKIYEQITTEVAELAGIQTLKPNGKPRPFKEVLQEVNEARSIIPQRFSSNGYTLFEELSNVIHGDADETVALTKFKPALQLVLGVVDEVSRDTKFSNAIDELGWNAETIDELASQEGAS